MGCGASTHTALEQQKNVDFLFFPSNEARTAGTGGEKKTKSAVKQESPSPMPGETGEAKQEKHTDEYKTMRARKGSAPHFMTSLKNVLGQSLKSLANAHFEVESSPPSESWAHYLKTRPHRDPDSDGHVRTSSLWWPSVCGKQLLSRRGLVDTDKALQDKDKVGVLFAAHWCADCERFTQTAKDMYKNLLATTTDFEIIFASADYDKEEFEHHTAQMPWLRVPFSEVKSFQDKLEQRLSNKNLDLHCRFMIFDKFGDVICHDGRESISQLGEAAYPFSAEHLQATKQAHNTPKPTLKSSFDPFPTSGAKNSAQTISTPESLPIAIADPQPRRQQGAKLLALPPEEFPRAPSMKKDNIFFRSKSKKELAASNFQSETSFTIAPYIKPTPSGLLHPQTGLEFPIEHEDFQRAKGSFLASASAVSTVVAFSSCQSAAGTSYQAAVSKPSEDDRNRNDCNGIDIRDFSPDLDSLARQLPDLFGPTSPLQYLAVILGAEDKQNSLLACLSQDKKELSALKCGVVVPHLDDELGAETDDPAATAAWVHRITPLPLAEEPLALIHAIADQHNPSSWSDTGQLLVLERCNVGEEEERGWDWRVVAGQAASHAMEVGMEGFPWSEAKMEAMRIRWGRRGSENLRRSVDEFIAEEEEEASRSRGM